MSKNTVDLQAIQTEYGALRSTADRFADELLGQLRKLIGDSGIILAFPIQCRVKRLESLIEKLERLSMKPKSVLEIQDLVGLRMILLFRSDLQRVIDLITDTFVVLTKYDTGDRLKADQFGYASIHFVVALPKGWLAVPTLAGMEKMRAEIQLRTLAQHMWAEASQALQYKREDSVPPPIRRALYRGAALLETLDLEFDRIIEQRESYRQSIDASGVDQALNVDVLEKALDALLPAKNKEADESYDELLVQLLRLGVDNTGKLREIARKHLPAAEKEEARRTEKELERLQKGKRVIGSSPDRVKRGVYYTHAGFLRNILRYEFGDKVVDAAAEKRRRGSDDLLDADDLLDLEDVDDAKVDHRPGGNQDV